MDNVNNLEDLSMPKKNPTKIETAMLELRTAGLSIERIKEEIGNKLESVLVPAQDSDIEKDSAEKENNDRVWDPTTMSPMCYELRIIESLLFHQYRELRNMSDRIDV